MNALVQAIKVENEKISVEEAIRLSADDPSFYGQFFFPKTCRQASPPFHLEMWDTLLSQERQVAFDVFRGGAKTSVVRLFLSYIVAFGISRTILVVGKSQEAAVRTVEWLQRAVEFNSLWAGAFGLRKGSKWTGSEIDIWHGTDEVPIWVIALGITGSVRGVNVDDYRPDLIIVDDPCDEENTATEEQRKKISELFFGALAKSLAPRSEAPLAKMVLLQTPLNEDDLISQACRDPSWLSVVYGCFDASGQSRWPERWTTEELLKEKQAHIARGQLSLWLREMECKVVDDSTAAFQADRIGFWDVFPEEGRTIIAVDPTPPPKDSGAAINHKLDDAVVMVLRERLGIVYVLEVYYTKSPDPDEFISQIFSMAVNWRCREVHIESILFARVLATLLEKEMLRRRQWLTIVKVEDKRKKQLRIRQEIGSLLPSRSLKIGRDQTTLLERLTTYPAVNHDDDLDALAIGIAGLGNWLVQGEGDTIEGEILRAEREEYPPVKEEWRMCP